LEPGRRQKPIIPKEKEKNAISPLHQKKKEKKKERVIHRGARALDVYKRPPSKKKEERTRRQPKVAEGYGKTDHLPVELETQRL
jgi:hypothetical protein